MATSTMRTTMTTASEEIKKILGQQERERDRKLETKGQRIGNRETSVEKLIGSPTETTGPGELPLRKDLTADQYLTYWIDNYIHYRGLNQFFNSLLNVPASEQQNKLPRVSGSEERKQLENHLLESAREASHITKRIPKIKDEFALDLSILNLYNVAVLIDDSGSMAGGERRERIKSVLKTIAKFISLVTNGKRGILTVRFLNGGDTGNKIKEEDVDNLIDAHEFGGETRLGQALIRKILGDFVYKFKPGKKLEIQSYRKMKRPLLIVVITDGEVDEGRLALQAVLENTQKWAARAPKGPGNKAVVFQFAGVGENREASEFLKELDNQKTPVDISAIVDYQAERQGDEVVLEDILVNDARNQVAKLVLGPIIRRFDEHDMEDDGDMIIDRDDGSEEIGVAEEDEMSEDDDDDDE